MAGTVVKSCHIKVLQKIFIYFILNLFRERICKVSYWFAQNSLSESQAERTDRALIHRDDKHHKHLLGEEHRKKTTIFLLTLEMRPPPHQPNGYSNDSKNRFIALIFLSHKQQTEEQKHLVAWKGMLAGWEPFNIKIKQDRIITFIRCRNMPRCSSPWLWVRLHLITRCS